MTPDPRPHYDDNVLYWNDGIVVDVIVTAHHGKSISGERDAHMLSLHHQDDPQVVARRYEG